MVKRDLSYDYIRIIATIAIILCHFFQVRGCYAAFSWLNIGVQVFFVLSAKLLCQKDVTTKEEIVTFYKRRISRICLPVWIYLLCLIPLLFVVGRGPTPSAIVLYAVGMAGFAPTGVLGLGHFWYITVLLICYLLVPVLIYIDRIAREKSPLIVLLIKGMTAVAAVLLFIMTPWVHFGVNIALFIISYFYFRSTLDRPRWNRTLTLRLLPLAIAAVVVRLYLDSFTAIDSRIYEFVSTSSKAVLGLFLFSLLHLLFSRFGSTHFSRGITMLSNTSYEVYIVHQFILLALCEYVPRFLKGDFLSGLALLVVATIMIAANTVVLYITKIKIERSMCRRIH